MTGERERTRKREEESSPDETVRNTLNIQNSDEAGERLVSRVENDEPVVDIDRSQSYAFARKLRSRFREFL